MKRLLNKHERKAQLTILGVLLLLILIVISTGNAKAQDSKQTSLEYHQKLQKEYSYETWKKNQPKKKLENAKFELKVSKERSKHDKQTAKLNRKIEAIKSRIR